MVVAIEDSGRGIEYNFLPHVFEMFRQGDARISRRQSGMGIGLALVRQLVDLHHGPVTVESEGLNKGTRVTIRLPEKTDWNLNIVPSSQSDTTALQQWIVLVVDDDEDTAEMLRHHLQGLGATVFTATTGEEALRIAQERDLDVFVSDISMPGTDGLDLLRQLRALPGAKHVPAVAMTGLGQPDDQKRTKDAGFTAHLTKPIEFTALVDVLQQAVKKEPHRN